MSPSPLASCWSLRRNVFQERLVDALAAADEIILAEVYAAEQIPEGERLDPRRLVEQLRGRRCSARFVPDVDEIVALLTESASPGDALAIMSNGAFDGLHDKLLEALGSRS